MGWFDAAFVTSGSAGLDAFWLIGTFAKVAVLLSSAFALSLLLRHRASASTRHRVWVVALVSVLLVPFFSSILPAWSVPILPQGFAASAASGAIPELPNRAPAAEPSAASSLPTAAPQSLPEAAGGEAGRDGVSPLPFTAGRSDIGGMVVAIWIAGSLLLLARLLISSATAWWICREAQPITEAAWVAEARSLQRRLGLRGEVRLMRSRRTSMPMAWGLLKPTVLLPDGAEAWSAARRRVVLLHEMAHLKRRDCQTLLVARVATALHWVNPLVWIASRRLQTERERACDDLVLVAGTRGPDYAEHLLAIARAACGGAEPRWAAVAMARRTELEGRVLAILDPGRKRQEATVGTSIAGMVLVGALVLPLAALQPAIAQPGPADGPMAHHQPDDHAVDESGFVAPGFDESGFDEPGFVPPAPSFGHAPHSSAVPSREPVPSKEKERAQAEGTDPRVRAAVMVALGDEEWSIREQAAQSLGELEDPQSVDALGTTLGTDEQWQVREAAAWALGMIEDAAAVAALSDALTDAAWQVREQAAWALGMIEDPAPVAALSAALRHDEQWQVREEAAWALGMIEDEAALDALLDAMTDENVEVRKQVLWAVGHISR